MEVPPLVPGWGAAPRAVDGRAHGTDACRDGSHEPERSERRARMVDRLVGMQRTMIGDAAATAR